MSFFLYLAFFLSISSFKFLSLFDSTQQIQEKFAIPHIFLSFNETKIINLNDYYRGPNISFLFDHFEDNYLSFEQTQIQFSSQKPFDPNLLDIVMFSDQTGTTVTGAILTDSNSIYPFKITNIYSSKSEFFVGGFLNLISDLECKDIKKLTNNLVILDCNMKEKVPQYTNSTGEFLFVEFIDVNDEKKINTTIIRVGNEYPEYYKKSNLTTYLYQKCTRTIKIYKNYLYRFCKNSIQTEISKVIQIFKLDFKQKTAVFFREINDTSNSTTPDLDLKIQDIDFYDEFHLYVLDNNFGLFGFNIENNKVLWSTKNFPTLSGQFFYNVFFECFDKGSLLFDVYQNCKIILTSSHYITEMKVGNDFSGDYILKNRKNLGNSQNTIYDTFFTTQFVYVILENNQKQRFLNVYEREDENTNLFYQLALTEDINVRLMKYQNSFLADHQLNKVGFFYKNQRFFRFLDITPNLIELQCCKSNSFHENDNVVWSVDLNFKIIGSKNDSKKFSIKVHIVDSKNSHLYYENEDGNNQINLKISFFEFYYPIENIIRGPDKTYAVRNEHRNLRMQIEEKKEFDITNNTNTKDCIYFKSIQINYVFYFFIQYKDYSVNVSRCYADDDKINCWAVSKLNFTKQIQNIYSKKDRIIIKTLEPKSHLHFYMLNQATDTLVFDGIFMVNHEEFVCPAIIFNLFSENVLCVNTFENNSGFNFLFFDPLKYEINITVLNQAFLTAGYSNENLSYFDNSLLNNNIVLAKGGTSIFVFKIEFNEENNASISKIIELKNEFTNVKNKYEGYHFVISKPNEALSENNMRGIKLIIINYEQNVIVEYYYDSLINPIFNRFYPLYNLILCIDTVPVIDEIFLLIKVKNQNNDQNFVIYNIYSQSGDNLMKLNYDISYIYSINEKNLPSKSSDHLEFLIKYKGKDNLYFNEMVCPSLYGSFNFPYLSRSLLYINDTINLTANYNQTDNYSFMVETTNGLSDSIKTIDFTINFDYSNIFIDYSKYFLDNIQKNFTSIDFSTINSTEVFPFFKGPIVNYEIINNNSGVNYSLKSYIEKLGEIDLIMRINEFNNKTTDPILNKSKLSEFKLEKAQSIMEKDNFLFVLIEKLIYMFNIVYQNNNLIDVFDLSYYQFIDSCNNIYQNDNFSYFYLNCLNNDKYIKLYLFEYNNLGIFRDLRQVDVNSYAHNVNDVISSQNILFIVEKNNLNNREAMLQILVLNFSSLNWQTVNSTSSKPQIISVTNSKTINSELLNVDYLFISNFDVIILGNIDIDYIYGIIINDGYDLYYTEIRIEPVRTKPPIFTLKKLSVSTLFIDDYRKTSENALEMNHFLLSNNNGFFNILISSIYQTIEIQTNRFHFSEYSIIRKYQEYADCENKPQTYHIKKNDKFLINACNFLPLNKDGQMEMFLKLYSKNITQNYQKLNLEQNFTIPITQMVHFDLTTFYDLFLVQNKINISNLCVLLTNGTILSYKLNEFLYFERNLLNRSEINKSDNSWINITLWAKNNFSNASVVIFVFNGDIPYEDLMAFYCLILLPILLCILGMVCLFSVIKFSRKKRLESLKKPILMNNINANANLIN